MIERTSVTVYLENTGLGLNLGHDAHVYYKSQKSNYAIIYFDKKNEEKILESLKHNDNIKSIEKSEVPYEKYKF